MAIVNYNGKIKREPEEWQRLEEVEREAMDVYR